MSSHLTVLVWSHHNGAPQAGELVAAEPTRCLVWVRTPGAIYDRQVAYRQIDSVHIKYTDGETLETWGRPIADAIAQVIRFAS